MRRSDVVADMGDGDLRRGGHRAEFGETVAEGDRGAGAEMESALLRIKASGFPC